MRQGRPPCCATGCVVHPVCIDPGQVYAQLILSGQRPFPFDNTEGSGGIELPTNGWAWWGKVSVSDGQRVDIPITISGERANTFDAALWWPEGGFRIFGFEIDFHSDIDLQPHRPWRIDPRVEHLHQ